jgi:2-methylisocitrate lyase-like PEP mutase family enzyme
VTCLQQRSIDEQNSAKMSELSTDTLQHAKATVFRALHQRPGIFVIPNPWDAGSAKILASFGFEALTSTSAGLAYTLGKVDGQGLITKEETLTNAGIIAGATHLPVAADLENGFGDEPADCAASILDAARAGLVGGSIEDATGRKDSPFYPFELAVERVEAAVAAARSLDFPFTLVARAEGLLYGAHNLKEITRRLEAFAAAGADVLFAPGLRTGAEISQVVRAVAPLPVNVVMGLSDANFTLQQLEALGVKRVSLGSSLARAALGAFYRAAQEINQKGSFDFAKEAIPYATLNGMFRQAGD